MKADWLALCSDLWGRLRTIADPARLMYFVFVVVGIGGLGVWQSSMALLQANLATYAMGSRSRIRHAIALAAGLETLDAVPLADRAEYAAITGNH